MISPRFASCLVLVGLLAGFYLPVDAQAPVLKGRAAKDEAASLRRDDIRPSDNDPFSGTDENGELLELPKNYKMEAPRKPVQQARPFNLNAQQQGNPFHGQPQMPAQMPMDMGGEPDQMPPQQVQRPPAVNPNDPDSSPEMQLAWDEWHRRVAQCIFERFNFFAKAAFRHSPPLMAKLTYTVTRDGQIINVNMPQKASNVLFNVLVHQSVKSLNGDMSILAFPQGSRRMWVPKSGTFTQNYGNEGFRYTVGDRETVQGR